MPIAREIRKAIRRVPGLGGWLEDFTEWRVLRRRGRRFPEFSWMPGPRCPQARVEASRMQIGPKLLVFGGYITLDRVSRRVDLFDMSRQCWQALGEMPDGVPQTHSGIAWDGGEHVYLVGGQIGANCSPVSSACWSFHIGRHSWNPLPHLPEGRYMPLVHERDGRLHCLSGSKPDRRSPAHEHWSIGIHDGCATERAWRQEVPLPSPRTHTASYRLGDEILVFGGQTGDVPAVEGDPDYACDFNSPLDEVMDEVYAFHLDTGALRMLAPMPEKISHTEHAVLRIGDWMVIAGGVLDRNRMSDLVLAYDLRHDRWQTIGRLPYPMKSKIVGLWENRLYLVTGQRSRSEIDLRSGRVLDTVWHAALPEPIGLNPTPRQ